MNRYPSASIPPSTVSYKVRPDASVHGTTGVGVDVSRIWPSASYSSLLLGQAAVGASSLVVHVTRTHFMDIVKLTVDLRR